MSEDEILDMTKMLTARQFAQYGMAGLDDEIITRYAKEQLQKDEVRNRVEEQVRTAKIYSAVENAVTLDKKEVSLEEFKKIAEEA